jgi:hypothetical protein
VKSQPQNDFFGRVGFGRVVFWSSVLLVKLSFGLIGFSGPVVVELSFGLVAHIRSQALQLRLLIR